MRVVAKVLSLGAALLCLGSCMVVQTPALDYQLTVPETGVVLEKGQFDMGGSYSTGHLYMQGFHVNGSYGFSDWLMLNAAVSSAIFVTTSRGVSLGATARFLNHRIFKLSASVSLGLMSTRIAEIEIEELPPYEEVSPYIIRAILRAILYSLYIP